MYNFIDISRQGDISLHMEPLDPLTLTHGILPHTFTPTDMIPLDLIIGSLALCFVEGTLIKEILMIKAS
jgi:hypothetical protein